jgi:hypothetical protein
MSTVFVVASKRSLGDVAISDPPWTRPAHWLCVTRSINGTPNTEFSPRRADAEGNPPLREAASRGVWFPRLTGCPEHSRSVAVHLVDTGNGYGTLRANVRPLPIQQSSPAQPKTIDEAVNFLLNVLSQEEIEAIRRTPGNDLAALHFPLGMRIRNGFGLWDDNTGLPLACGASHPDDASTTIIKALWEKLHPDE